MNKLRVCFVGVGSIAKRHIRNLEKISASDNIEIIIDAVSRSGFEIQEDSNKENTNSNTINADVYKIINKFYASIDDIDTVYDAIFITNPTDCHMKTLEKASSHARNFFIEKPIVSLTQLSEIKKYCPKADAVYYVACPLRYNAVIQYIKNNIPKEDVISVRSISSSYLPDWRPGQDYRNTYSAHKDMGGGVSIDLIHEWDYLTFLFGNPQSVSHMCGRKSSLEIDSDDYAIYIGEYSDKIVELHLDYFGRKTIREVMIFTEDDTIIGDIANNRISFMKEGRSLDFHEERDDFQIRELGHFLDMIDGKCEQDSSIEHAIKVLELTQGVL